MKLSKEETTVDAGMVVVEITVGVVVNEVVEMDGRIGMVADVVGIIGMLRVEGVATPLIPVVPLLVVVVV